MFEEQHNMRGHLEELAKLAVQHRLPKTMAALLPLLLVDESNKDCTWDWAAVYKHLDNTSKTVAFSLARLPSALRSKEGLGSVRDAAHVLEVALADAKWADQQEPEPEAVEQPEVVAGADPASMDQEALPQAPAHAPPSSAGGGEEAAAAEATAGPQAGAPPTAQQLGQMPYKEVQQLAKELGLKASGKAQELIDRITAHHQQRKKQG